MPVPSAITDLSATAASNSPSGSDAPSVLDDHQRALGAFIRQLYDLVASASGSLTSSAFSTGNLTYSGTLTGSTGVVNIGSGQIYKDAGGNVGVGTTSPGAKLEVAGTFNVSLQSSGTYASVRGASGASSNLLLQPNAGLGTAYWITAKNAAANLEIGGNGGTEPGQGAISITSSGSVGIGTSSPTAKLHVNGPVRLDASTTTSATAGANGDVPAQVVGYLTVNINGTDRKIPYYA